MNDFVIFADSSCDISPALLKEWGVPYCSLTLKFSDDETEYSNDEIVSKEFYQKMRDGIVAKTSATNSYAFQEAFASYLEAGKDLLYIGFSSGLSNTYNSGRLAAQELQGQFPDRKILTVDTLCASAGYGLILYLALEKKKQGATIEETAQYVLEMVPHLCHWFTVDDLMYLKRGGRISSTTALVGGILGIKPVLHVDDEGHLVGQKNVRGRKAALRAMAEKYGELALDPKDGPVFISHGDCLADAEALGRLLKEGYGAELDLITDVGPVIGAHSGPGTLALFFLGEHR